MKPLSLFTVLIAATFLSGCVDRATADAKLQKGCIAAINAFQQEDDEVGNVVNAKFSDLDRVGSANRKVELDVEITDGFHSWEESHACIFMEEFAIGRISYRASIYQLDLGGRIIGQHNYKIQGSLEDMQKLTDAVDKALGQ